MLHNFVSIATMRRTHFVQSLVLKCCIGLQGAPRRESFGGGGGGGGGRRGGGGGYDDGGYGGSYGVSTSYACSA